MEEEGGRDEEGLINEGGEGERGGKEEDGELFEK